MRRLARRALLQLALEDAVAIVRTSLDRNRYGDDRPSTVYQELATAMDRFDRLGGFEVMTLELWRDEVGAVAHRHPPTGSGPDRTGSDPRPAADHRAPLDPNGIARDRASSQPREETRA